MANFRSKIIFYKTNIEDGQKVPWKSAPLILNCICYEKKKYFFANFLWFLRFSQIQLPGGKIRDWYKFVRIFLILWHLCWPWVRINFEMVNSEAKTPCVLCEVKCENTFSTS